MKWAEGSPERAALHGAVAAAVASLGGGNVGKAVTGAVANQVVMTTMSDYLLSHGYETQDPEYKALMQAGSAAVGAAVGGESGAVAALDATKYNHLTHQQIDDLNQALHDCATEQCRSDAVSAAKQQSQLNDVALAIVCNAGASSACYQGLGALESYYESPVVPRDMHDDQVRDRQLEQSQYFGDIGFFGGLAASYYANTPQQGGTGEFLSGAGAAFGNKLLPFVGSDEGVNPNSPFIPAQLGGAAPQFTDGMSAGAAQGVWLGQVAGDAAWALAGNEGKALPSKGVLQEGSVGGSQPGYPSSLLSFERQKAGYAADEIKNAEPVGSALKDDPLHRARSLVIDEIPERGRVFTIQGGDKQTYNLTQMEGTVKGNPGVFEWIVNSKGELTHQRFIPGGQITGTPNQIPARLPTR